MARWRKRDAPDPTKVYDQDNDEHERKNREIDEENARIAEENARRKQQEQSNVTDASGNEPVASIPDPLLATPQNTGQGGQLPPLPRRAHIVVVDTPTPAGPVTTVSSQAPSLLPLPPATQPPTPSAAPPQRPSVPLSMPAQGSQGASGPARRHTATAATAGLVESQVIGGGSKFGSSDWWDVSPNKRWWKLTPSGLSADFLCDAGTIGDSAVIAGSMRGWKHQIKGEQNEDSFFLGSASDKNGSGYVVAVLADGLSSAKYSGYGSRRITQMIGRSIASRIETATAVDAAWAGPELAGVLATAAQRVGRFDTSDYGAPTVESSEVGERDVLVTLTIAIVQAELSPDGSRRAVAGFIGDSPLFVLGEDGWTKMTAIDPSEEIVENRTSAFPAVRMCSIVEFDIAVGEVIVMVSDGVGNFIGHGEQKLALGEFLREQWARPVNALTFLNHLNFNLNSADDDRTAIAIWSAVETEG